MHWLLDHPLPLLLASFALLWGATRFGAALRLRHGLQDDARRGDFDIVLGATLTLLGLIVGFSFSMASNRYDQRKNLEEGEANAIGTAYARAALLPAADAETVRGLLKEYAGLRVRFYTSPDLRNYLNASLDLEERRSLYRETGRAQERLWAAVAVAASSAPSPVVALAVAATNDAINSQGYAQAAAWNRIPGGAWLLLYVLAIASAGMVGYRLRATPPRPVLMLIQPGVVAISFFLIADIDCPRGGFIRVAPQNLVALEESLRN